MKLTTQLERLISEIQKATDHEDAGPAASALGISQRAVEEALTRITQGGYPAPKYPRKNMCMVRPPARVHLPVTIHVETGGAE